MSNCIYTIQGDFVCNKKTIEHFNDLPNGSYKTSCINCSNNNNNNLSCDCRSNGGNYYFTTLKLTNSGNGADCDMNNPDIRNYNSTLTCNFLGHPQGPYRQTCPRCWYTDSEKKLKCRCKKSDETYNVSTLYNCYGNKIENNNGTLVCK
jgi:hypothetical protein